jgi:phenylacetate-CoA ligase
MRVSYDIDRLPVHTIKKIQGELLSDAVSYACEHLSHYRKAFDHYGVNPHDIMGADDIIQLPFTTREDIQKNNWSFLGVPRTDIAEIVSTTGTTSSPVFIALTENDLTRLAYNEEKSFRLTGAEKGDSFHIAVTSDNLFIAGMAYYRGLIKLGASVVRTGPQNPIRHLDLIGSLRPAGIVATPYFMIQLLKYVHDSGLDARELGLKRIVLIGDTIRNMDCSTNPLGSLIENSFGEICYSTYGITEGQISFCECPSRVGLHSHPDLVLAEVVDDEGRQVPDGEPGELVLTSLQIEAMPLIRYRTGDITVRIPGPCACGRNSVRICSIIGRKDQRLKIKGVTLYPKTIENAVYEIKDVINYQIEAYTGEDYTDRISLRVGTHRTDRDFRSSLVEYLHAKTKVPLKVNIESPHKVQKRLFAENSSKAALFKDRRVSPA